MGALGAVGSLFLFATVAFLPRTSSLELRAVFDMSGIKGDVMFTWVSATNTSITVNLTGLIANYTWKIHKFPVVYRGNVDYTCKPLYTGGIFDPSSKNSSVTYATQCNISSPADCAVGDLNGKHGYLKRSTANTFDTNLPLDGPRSIFGRSLVLFDEKSTPVACALIDATHDVVTAVATFRGAISGITGTVTLRQSRSNPSLFTTVDVNLFYSNYTTSGSKNFTLTISDEKLPDEGIPSYQGSNCPTAAAKEREILQNVDIPLARNGPSTERRFLSVGNISLTGANFVIGKTLLLALDGSTKICASIYELLPIEAEGVFDVDGVQGNIHFKQNSELSPTIVTANVWGMKAQANKYHVHVYKLVDNIVSTHQNKRGMCAGKYLSGHWNPYGVSSAEPGNGTVDQYEIGDLSGKYGTIGEHDKLSMDVFKDYNLPLFGVNSILYRSLVIHYKNGSRWVCTNISPKNATFHFKAASTFTGPDFHGVISAEQASFVKNYAYSHITSFFLQLQSINESAPATDHHNWHIHKDRVTLDRMLGMGERCKSPLSHYNPYNVYVKSNYASTCGPSNPLRCELGDLSSKLGKCNVGGIKRRFTESENYFAGLNQILGRSIVVHVKNSGSSRLGCASLKAVSPSFVQKDFTLMKNNKTNEIDFQKLLSQALNTSQWRVANVHINDFDDCQRVNFTLIESSTSRISHSYEELKNKWPSNLEAYTPVTEDKCKERKVHRKCTEGDYCHKYATCADTGPGTYKCTCNEGYNGDGKTCTGSNASNKPQATLLILVLAFSLIYLLSDFRN